MTKLLISVRNAWEAHEALAGGANIIDVKEPRWGSLGAASPETWQEVRRVCHGTQHDGSPVGDGDPVVLSAALGELADFKHRPISDQLAGFSYAKVGLAGWGLMANWKQAWRRWIAVLPVEIRPVAVVYADYRDANSPTPREVIASAAEANVRMLLLDTCDKKCGDLFARMTISELTDLIGTARDLALQIAFAGSLTFGSLEMALSFAPDVIAVRGGVCRGGRGGILDRDLVKRFARRLSTPGEERAA
jgi:uncharacterized protein (UPF0264 family)